MLAEALVRRSSESEKLNYSCDALQSLQLNIRGILLDATAFQSVRFSLPETLKSLRLLPLLESEAILLINRFKVTGSCLSKAALLSPSPSFTLQSLPLEVRGAFLLSDLAFHDVTGSSCYLQEVRLSTCPLITSEAVKKLALCTNLELLDLGSCRSISDSCLNTVSALGKLTSLNLAGADVTASGMVALSKSDVPIMKLSFRGCKRVSDRGISHLLSNEGIISRTLSTLDLCHMPGISDRAIHTITRYCKALTELSIRSCFHVTDSSIEFLATREGQTEGGSKQLRKLNVHNCVRLTTGALRWLSKPSFAGLHWLGLEQTRFAGRRETATATICEQRPGPTLCFGGCELGCYDGWEFHTLQRH